MMKKILNFKFWVFLNFIFLFVDALVALDIVLEKLLFELLWIELFLYIIPSKDLFIECLDLFLLILFFSLFN